MSETKLVYDDQEWRDFLKQIDSKLKNPTKLLQLLYFTFGFKDIVEHFENEESSSGKWEKRKTTTDAMYDKIGGTYRSSNKLLQLTGKLRGSLLQGNAANKSSVKNSGKYAIAVFANAEYAGTHNEGYKGIPKREFMWMSDKSKELMCKGVLDYLLKGKE